MPKSVLSVDKLSPAHRRLVETIGGRIASARAATGLTALALARQMECSRGTIGQWESGVYIPSLVSVFALAERLRAPIHWLLLDEGPSRQRTRGVLRVSHLMARGLNRELDVLQIDEVPKAWIGSHHSDEELSSTALKGDAHAPGYGRGDRVLFTAPATGQWDSGDYLIWYGDQLSAVNVTPTFEGSFKVRGDDTMSMTREELSSRAVGRIVGRFHTV